LLSWQVRAAVTPFLIAASEHPPDATNEADVTPYWIKSEDANEHAALYGGGEGSHFFRETGIFALA